VYVVDGQIDSYRDFLPRLLANLKVPRKGLMGPWVTSSNWRMRARARLGDGRGPLVDRVAAWRRYRDHG